MDSEVIRILKAAMVLEGIPDKQIKRVIANVRKFHKATISDALLEVLQEYEQRYNAGERVKLKDLAESHGVNIGSLRQAKVRYDAAKKQNEDIDD